MLFKPLFICYNIDRYIHKCYNKISSFTSTRGGIMTSTIIKTVPGLGEGPAVQVEFIDFKQLACQQTPKGRRMPVDFTFTPEVAMTGVKMDSFQGAPLDAMTRERDGYDKVMSTPPMVAMVALIGGFSWVGGCFFNGWSIWPL
jgi:hypothetical protein